MRTHVSHPRSLVQPGPVHPERIESHAGRLVAVEFELEPGKTLCEAVAEPLRQHGIEAGAVDLSGMRLGPVQYVMPTYSSTPDHVAYYSHTHLRPDGFVVEEATATFGSREGAPFLHCHALWHDADGSQRGGHILPLDTLVRSPSRVSAWGTPDIAMRAKPDSETNFTLFGPQRVMEQHGAMIVARIRPNEDLIGAVETIARRHGIVSATVRSAIGSTVGARFENGPAIDEAPTEILGLSGTVGISGDGPVVDFHLALIDASGNIHRGRLKRGENPVLICTELFLEVTAFDGRQGRAA